MIHISFWIYDSFVAELHGHIKCMVNLRYAWSHVTRMIYDNMMVLIHKQECVYDIHELGRTFC